MMTIKNMALNLLKKKSNTLQIISDDTIIPNHVFLDLNKKIDGANAFDYVERIKGIVALAVMVGEIHDDVARYIDEQLKGIEVSVK